MRLPKVMPRESSRSQAMTLLPCLNRGLFFFINGQSLISVSCTMYMFSFCMIYRSPISRRGLSELTGGPAPSCVALWCWYQFLMQVMGLYHFFLLQALHVEICFSGKKSDIMVVPSKLCCTGSISRSYVICDRLIRVFSQNTKKSHGDKFHTARLTFFAVHHS